MPTVDTMVVSVDEIAAAYEREQEQAAGAETPRRLLTRVLLVPGRDRAALRGRVPDPLGPRGVRTLTARNRELLNLIAVGMLTGLGFASVYIARSEVVSPESLTYAAFFLASTSSRTSSRG